MEDQLRVQLQPAVDRLRQAAPYKLVLSNTRNKDSRFQKITIEQKQGGSYMATCFDGKQVFHEHFTEKQPWQFLPEQMISDFSRCNAWNSEREVIISISKKGKVLVGGGKTATAPKHVTAHNRTKNYLLSEDEPLPALIDMGIFSREGKLVKAMSDKFRQINRFLEMVDDVVKDWPSEKPLHIVDFGCGKSYLTFVLYHFLTVHKKLEVYITGLDLKEAVIEKCNRTAASYGYEKLQFCVGNIEGYKSDRPVDMMVSLHACDTATDAALWQAMRWQCRYIFSVPCCQHELNAQLCNDGLAPMLSYGLLRDRFATLLTDTIRATLLEAAGYEVQVLEFIDMAHTPKNILLRCRRKQLSKQKRRAALEKAGSLLAQFGVKQTLYLLCSRWIKESLE